MHKIEQLKWLYGGLAGVCAAFFLTAFSSSQSICSSVPLFLSGVCFGILLPIFTSFALVHIIFIEVQTPAEKIAKALSQNWVKRLTWFAMLLFWVGFTLLIFHISAFIGFIFLVSTLSILIAFRTFFRSLSEYP